MNITSALLDDRFRDVGQKPTFAAEPRTPAARVVSPTSTYVSKSGTSVHQHPLCGIRDHVPTCQASTGFASQLQKMNKGWWEWADISEGLLNGRTGRDANSEYPACVPFRPQ